MGATHLPGYYNTSLRRRGNHPRRAEHRSLPKENTACDLFFLVLLRAYGAFFAQVSKKSFADVAHLLDRAKRPTRLTFVRHACGRRFVSREKDGGFSAAAREGPGRTAFGLRKRGKRGKAGCRYEQLLCAGSAGRADQRSSSLSPQKLTKCYRQIEVGAEWVVVFVDVPARCAGRTQQLRGVTRRIEEKEICYSTYCRKFTIRRVMTAVLL